MVPFQWLPQRHTLQYSASKALDCQIPGQLESCTLKCFCAYVWWYMQVLRDAHSLAALKQDPDAEADASTGDSAATPFAAPAVIEKVRSCAGCERKLCQAACA